MTRKARLQNEALGVLRHVLVHGPRTRPELEKALGLSKSNSTISNLQHLAYLAADHTTKPVTYILTGKARAAISSMGMAGQRKAGHDGRTGSGAVEPLQDSVRPGAMDAYSLPSRMGNRLHYRSGLVTDMSGTPITP